jgi:hypothetical protein
MEKNIDIIKRLAEDSDGWFTREELKEKGVNQDKIEELEIKGILKVNRSNNLPKYRYYLTDSAYIIVISKEMQKAGEETKKLTATMLTVAKETQKAGEETKKLTAVMLGFTSILLILTLFQIYTQFVMYGTQIFPADNLFITVSSYVVCIVFLVLIFTVLIKLSQIYPKVK